MHKSVMLKEASKYLEIKPNGLYLDLTFGFGGHSNEILKYLNSFGRLFTLDNDNDAYLNAKKIYKTNHKTNTFKFSFDNIYFILNKMNLLKSVDGVIVDLGISLTQIKSSSKGFGFTQDNFLDMRLDTENIIRIIDWINFASPSDLECIFNLFGEKSIVKFIIEKLILFRNTKQIKTTNDLCSIFLHFLGETCGQAMLIKLFQFMRNFANNDFLLLKKFLKNIFKLLRKNGIMILISFNSLEEHFIKKLLCNSYNINFFSIQASGKEININLSSRSANMYVIKNNIIL